MRSNFEKICVEIYGESHSEKIGVAFFGVPAGEVISEAELKAFLKRRQGGNDSWATLRAEDDAPTFTGGLEFLNGEAVSDGGEIDAYIENNNIKPFDYKNISSTPRPSHADYMMFARDGKISTGGGRFSGRMTAPLCVAGGIAKQILEKRGIGIYAYVSSVGGVSLASYDDTQISPEILSKTASDSFPALSALNIESAKEKIKEASAERDSLGGTVECAVFGLCAGALGDALFEGLEGKISYSVFAVPAVKGVEFGSGFGLSVMKGSEANDAFCIKDGRVQTLTNRSGGINGGISNGMPLTMRVAIRPTPSIAKVQRSVELDAMVETEISVKGRHDACIVPRAVPCIESAVALAILDEALKYGII